VDLKRTIMINFFKIVFKCLIISIVTIYLLGLTLNSSYRNGEYFKTQWLSKIKNKKYDYIVVGNSRVEKSISVSVFDQKVDTKGLNLGMENTTFSTFYLMLHLFFKNKNKADYVLLEFDHHNYHNFKDKNQSHLFIPQINDSDIYSTLVDINSKYHIIRFLPFIGYGYYNFDWGIHNFLNQKFKLFNFPFLENGDTKTFTNYSTFTDTGRKASYNYKSDLNKYFLKIKNLCEKNNSRLITFTAPFFDKNVEKGNIKDIKTILSEHQIEYHDYSSLYFQRKDMFFDNNHLNRIGTTQFSKVLSELVE
jgi:hypothetical protein